MGFFDDLCAFCGGVAGGVEETVVAHANGKMTKATLPLSAAVGGAAMAAPLVGGVCATVDAVEQATVAAVEAQAAQLRSEHASELRTLRGVIEKKSAEGEKKLAQLAEQAEAAYVQGATDGFLRAQEELVRLRAKLRAAGLDPDEK